jgi:hypothetical protein
VPDEPEKREDEPAATRPERVAAQPVPAARRPAFDADDLEIPSFLRRR